MNIGDKHGRLTAVRMVERDARGRAIWGFQCDCGTVRIARADHVKSGRTTSCGCFMRETVGERFSTHGQTRTDLHVTWTNMKQRCENPNHPDYVRYGGRGIKVDPLWQMSFETFADDMGPKPAIEYTIERKDNNGDYCKDNCVWATRKEQANNRGGY